MGAPLAHHSQLASEYDNIFHHSVNEKLINADYSALNGKIETNSKSSQI